MERIILEGMESSDVRHSYLAGEMPVPRASSLRVGANVLPLAEVLARAPEIQAQSPLEHTLDIDVVLRQSSVQTVYVEHDDAVYIYNRGNAVRFDWTKKQIEFWGGFDGAFKHITDNPSKVNPNYVGISPRDS
jgi:hypothetical protein